MTLNFYNKGALIWAPLSDIYGNFILIIEISQAYIFSQMLEVLHKLLCFFNVQLRPSVITHQKSKIAEVIFYSIFFPPISVNQQLTIKTAEFKVSIIK